jgi:hypothetical protein
MANPCRVWASSCVDWQCIWYVTVLLAFVHRNLLSQVEDYEPKKSLVISPAKMLKFYEDVRLQDEIYPWESMFGSALLKVYRLNVFQQFSESCLTPRCPRSIVTCVVRTISSRNIQRHNQTFLHSPLKDSKNG